GRQGGRPHAAARATAAAGGAAHRHAAQQRTPGLHDHRQRRGRREGGPAVSFRPVNRPISSLLRRRAPAALPLLIWPGPPTRPAAPPPPPPAPAAPPPT